MNITIFFACKTIKDRYVIMDGGWVKSLVALIISTLFRTFHVFPQERIIIVKPKRGYICSSPR